MTKRILFISFIIFSISACSSHEPIDIELNDLISNYPNSALEVGKANISTPLAQLGKQLFFSKSLSGDLNVACASCHHPLLGGGDNLALPIGENADNPDILGIARRPNVNDIDIPRNSPTTFNSGLWQRVMFWDGRLEKTAAGDILSPEENNSINSDDLLTIQAHFPVTSTAEMRGDDFEHGRSTPAVRKSIVNRLLSPTENNPWPERFAKQFGEKTKISYQHIATALAAYQRSQLFTNNAWNAYLDGDSNALTNDEKLGAKLFFSPNKSGIACASCHSGRFFTDEKFHAMGAPQIGPGKNNGKNESDDFGRARETRNRADLYKFRTPTLLNIAVTGPYLHNGSAETLTDAIRQHADPDGFMTSYLNDKRWCSLPPFRELENCEEQFPDTDQNSRAALAVSSYKYDLTDTDIEHIVAFLNTLTDPCVKSAACLKPWLPDEQDAEPHLLKAILH